MGTHTMAFFLAVLVWWLSTGLLIYICALPRRTFEWRWLGGFCVLAVSTYGLLESAWDVASTGPYIAFLSALGIWACIEMSFLMGLVTGPRTSACPEGITGWARFRLAVQALLYHELMIVGAAGAVVALTWDAPNQTGTMAFLILMGMRISAKLNIFLGVPNLTDEFLPARLDYLKSYFRKSQTSLLFPVSLVGAALVAMLLAQEAFAADGAQASGFALLLALMALAILEHLFMIIPLPDAVLWRWAVPASIAKQNENRLP